MRSGIYGILHVLTLLTQLTAMFLCHQVCLSFSAWGQIFPVTYFSFEVHDKLSARNIPKQLMMCMCEILWVVCVDVPRNSCAVSFYLVFADLFWGLKCLGKVKAARQILCICVKLRSSPFIRQIRLSRDCLCSCCTKTHKSGDIKKSYVTSRVTSRTNQNRSFLRAALTKILENLIQIAWKVDWRFIFLIAHH